MAPAVNRNVRPGRHRIILVVVLIAAIAPSGCAAGETSGTGGQADSASHRAGARSHRAAAATHQAMTASHRATAASHQPGAPPREVAQEFAMFYAKLAANEEEPASQAEVQALARQLAPSCSPPTDGQYPCVVHLPGRVPPTQNCVAVLASSGSVTGRCSLGTAPAPVVATGYVDCGSVGRVRLGHRSVERRQAGCAADSIRTAVTRY